MPEIAAATRFTFKVQGLSAITYVARFEADEAVSELFRVDLMLTSDDKDIAFADVVGKPGVLKLVTDGSEPRFLHGIVARFRHGEDGKKLTTYQATLVPKLWRLQHRHDSRIFQAMTVPAIIAQVLDGAGVTDHRSALTGSYSPREYCVQYRESDLAFICRLMEEEGIYYFFEHAEDKETLVLGDAVSAPAPIASPDSLAYKGTLGALAHGESVSRFSSWEEVRPGKVTLTDYNFKKPSLSLLSSTSGKLDADLELYDYPGEYDLPGDGSGLAKVRLEEAGARRAVGEGQSGCVRLTPGYTFSLADHPRDAENKPYLLTRVRHEGAQPELGEAASGHEGRSYHNSFEVIPAAVPFRPERRTPRPTIKGVQTAIVTGPGGEEIHVDEHGRVKVQFHWDRQGKKDDKSSCWIRVSQVWAGAGWGAMWIPRVGHEVVVDFLEGDPDRPIIVGRVYHGANVPPYPLPAEKTKSTIKSNSSKGGGGNNELRFEDKKGQEEIYLHGQKDWNIKIEHDKNQLVGHDETKKVGHDETYEIGNDQTLTVDHDRVKEVKNDQSEKIGRDKKTEVGRNHTETIGADESLSVGNNRSVVVKADHTENVTGSQTSSVGGDVDQSAGGSMTVAVGSNRTVTVGGNDAETVGKKKTSTVGEEFALTVGKDMTVTVSKNAKEEVSGEKTIIVAKKLKVQCGDATITVEKNGNVTVQGKKIVVKGDGPVEVNGSKIQVKSDGAVNLEASGKVVIKGSNVGVN
jgi:type VI secretion system secreted protein VgrG